MKKIILAATVAVMVASTAYAQEVTLRLHHFMPPPATLSKHFFIPWAEEMAAKTDGRLVVEVYPSMSLGGRPGDLIDQAIDGAVDISLTLTGYTPGRFNKSEVFELPFMMEDAEATSAAYYDMIQADLQDGELADAKILAAWVHGPGVLHTAEPVMKLEDMAGKELRGPTRVITDLLGEYGATPVGMPLPGIPEALSKGVINGTVLPWEITPAIKLGELVSNHTELGGDRALYTSTFILAMNWDAYEALPDDLRAILDQNTGKAMSRDVAATMVERDAVGRSVYEGNNIIQLSEDEVDRWIEAAQPVYSRWIERAGDKGFDGQATIDMARELISANR